MGTGVKQTPYQSWSTAKLKVHQVLIDLELKQREPQPLGFEAEAYAAARGIPGPAVQPPAVLMDFRSMDLPPAVKVPHQARTWRPLAFLKQA